MLFAQDVAHRGVGEGTTGLPVGLHKREEFFRKLVITFSKIPLISQNEIRFEIQLKPNEKWQSCIDYLTLVSEEEVSPKHTCKSHELIEKHKSEGLAKWISESPKIDTDYEPLKKAYEQSLIDLGPLRLQGADISGSEVVPAAGVPWFMTFFGRDTLITAFQTLIAYPQLARGALKILVDYQGERVNLETEEEPGKILHEIRFGELATMREIPQTPYYGTVDATLLFIILLSEAYEWTRDESLLSEFGENAEAALR